MMSKRNCSEAIVLLVDVGSNESCFEKSKQCTFRIIQRKLLSDSPDQIGLILIGAKKTKNNYGYPNINMKSDFLHLANWELLRDINNLSPSNVNNADWLDGLIVAIDVLKTEAEAKTFSKKKIMMISNCENSVRSPDHVDDVIDSLKNLGISLVVIGSHGNESEDEDEKKGSIIIGRIVDESDGVMCGFEEAMSQLAHAQCNPSRSVAWNCDLQIGENIFIPISGFKKFAEKKLFNWQKRSVDGKKITEETIFFHGDKQVEKSEVIKGYLFGQTVVPISDYDKASMTLKTVKSFQLIGFTKSKNVPRHILLGDPVHYILPRDGNEPAEKAIQSLVRACQEMDMVGIVRKVYNKNNAPRIGALFPVKEQDSYFFYFATLPYAEDERCVKLPSLEKLQPTQKQLDLVDNLIDAMDLSQFDEEDDPYKKIYNPAVDNASHLLTLKGLNPEEKLRFGPPDFVKKMIRPVPEILHNASDILEEIKNEFCLQELEQKKYKRGASDVFDRDISKRPHIEDSNPQIKVENISQFAQSTVTEVGTIDPEGNFLKLLDLNEPFASLCDQMKTAVTKLIFASSDSIGNKKPLSALSLLRKHCILQLQHPLYNEFIAKLKDDLVERDHEFWNLVVEEKLGLITSEETNSSGITAEEADIFYKIKDSSQSKQSEPSLELEAEDMVRMKAELVPSNAPCLECSRHDIIRKCKFNKSPLISLSSNQWISSH